MLIGKLPPDVSICRDCLDAQIEYGYIENCSKCSNNNQECKISIVIANNIRRYMEWKNISAEEIVEKTSFSKKGFGRVLSGDIIVAPWMLKEIAIVLGVTKKELMKGIRDNE